MSQRHPGTLHLCELLEPNPNLPAPLREIAELTNDLKDTLLTKLQDGPELTTGLRKLLEAKDCFVRQALIDGRSSSPS